MEAPPRATETNQIARRVERARLILVWGVWAALTLATLGFVRQFARNLPYMDDFELVSMMTGREPVNLGWLWAQHNEHRPLASRLILAGVYRSVAPDFRAGLYLNAAVLSAMAASMLLLVRRLRGGTRVTDCVLPLAVLNLGQAETLLISFALNLILTAWICCALIAVSARPRTTDHPWRWNVQVGLLLVFLPLSGGSGLVMLPPLVTWLAWHAIWARMRAADPDGRGMLYGIALVLACSLIVALYMIGYVPPAIHRPPPSVGAAWSTSLEYLSLVVAPSAGRYWRLAGYLSLAIVAATVTRLVAVAAARPTERPRALGLLALVCAMIMAAAAVGYSRAFLGQGAGLAGRYVTLSAPLLCAIYVAWLVYGGTIGRRGIHAVLFGIALVALPANFRFAHHFGGERRAVYQRIEHALRARTPSADLIDICFQKIHPDRAIIESRFQMLRDAGIGPMRQLVADRAALLPTRPAANRY